MFFTFLGVFSVFLLFFGVKHFITYISLSSLISIRFLVSVHSLVQLNSSGFTVIAIFIGFTGFTILITRNNYIFRPVELGRPCWLSIDRSASKGVPAFWPHLTIAHLAGTHLTGKRPPVRKLLTRYFLFSDCCL